MVRACRESLAPAQQSPHHASVQEQVLSGREREILVCMARGLSDREIAEHLVLSPHTVHRHVANIRRKLGVPHEPPPLQKPRVSESCEVAETGHLQKMAASGDCASRGHSYVCGHDRDRERRFEYRIAGNPPSAAWLRIFALVYDPFLWLGEAAGMRRRRSTLLAGAFGRVVEIGAGTGLNIAHYPEGVTELVLIEPEPGMRKKLSRRTRQHGCATRIVDASAEGLPLADASVDTVVSTLALCTVDEPEGALREIARVLRPGGQLLFIDMCAQARDYWRACQDKLAEPWRRFAGGCRCNRDTVERLRACGFTVAAQNVVWRGMPAIVRPLAMGRATRAADR